MSRYLKVLSLMLLLTGLMLGQVASPTTSSALCNLDVMDVSHILSPGALMQANQAISVLEAQAITPKIIVLNKLYDQSLGDMTAMIKNTCPSWQGPNKRSIKANLLVMILTLDNGAGKREFAVLYGPGLKPALDSNIDRIKAEAMLPAFKTGDWGLGFLQGARQLANRVSTSRSEAIAPKVINNNQAPPADLSGLWKVLGWLIFIVCLGGLIAFLYALFKSNKHEKMVASDGKSRAVAMRNQTNALFNSVRAQIEGMGGVFTTDKQKKASSLYQATAETVAETVNSVSNDPREGSLTEGEYNTIYNTWHDIWQDLRTIANLLAEVDYTSSSSSDLPPIPTSHSSSSSIPPSQPSPTPSAMAAATGSGATHHHHHNHTTVIERTVVQNNDPGMVTGILLGEALARPYDPTPEVPRYSEPDYTAPATEDKDFSGTSSSFTDAPSLTNFESSSDSSDSSSFSDSSSSDSFSSSSSDSGSSFDSGSSSSDFGGGGDSSF